MSTLVPGFAGELPPEQFNLARYCLQSSSERLPEKIALIICDDHNDLSSAQRWSYRQIETLVLRLAGGFSSIGLKRGDRVFIRMGNSFDYALVFFAANAAGLVPVPASSQLSVSEVALLVDDCGALAVISDGALPLPEIPSGVALVDGQMIEKFKNSEPIDYCNTKRNDPAFLIYTSGTTNLPKGVLHAQQAVWGRRPMYRDWSDLSQTDVLLHSGAFNWTYTLGTGLFDPWANGATSIVYTGEKDINVWPRLMKTYQASIFAAVPSLYRQILKYCDLQAADMTDLRHCLTAGESLPENIRDNWLSRTGKLMYEALGMSEISTYISSSVSRPGKPGSPGRVQSGRCVAILPEKSGTEPLEIDQRGVIAIHRSDPGLMLGYWKRPEEQSEVVRGDWFISGDLATMDSDGFIWFGGRNDDLMNAFGYRVSPVEVEAALLKHPDVDHAGVCTIDVGDNIEIIAGFLVNDTGVDIDVADVARFAAERLAVYKVPKKLFAVDALPCNARGKLLRKELVALIEPSQ